MRRGRGGRALGLARALHLRRGSLSKRAARPDGQLAPGKSRRIKERIAGKDGPGGGPRGAGTRACPLDPLKSALAPEAGRQRDLPGTRKREGRRSIAHVVRDRG